MNRLIAYKIAQAVPVVLLVSVLAFLLMLLLPGDPAVVIAGEQASPEAIAAVRRSLGLDRPVLAQLGLWLGHLAQGDFGSSLVLNQTVLSAVAERLPVTLSLTGLSLAITLPVGIAIGAIAAYHRQTWVDSLVMSVALIGVSIPAFWIAILAVILFCVILGWFPSSGYVPLLQDPAMWLQSLVLPAGILSLFQIGFLARMTRSAMLDVLSQDFIRTARAKGLSDPGDHRHRHPAVGGDRRFGGARAGLRAARDRPPRGAGDPGARLSAGPGRDADLRLHLRRDQPGRRPGLHLRRPAGAL